MFAILALTAEAVAYPDKSTVTFDNAELNSDKFLRLMLRPLSKLKKVSEDLYTAEDDFWKITSWAMEKQRLGNAYTKSGITKNVKELEEEAADIIRNNIPNYDYVGDFIKGLRKLPFGNFVSFPAEILRTSTNIIRRGLDEITMEVKNDKGELVKPLAGSIMPASFILTYVSVLILYPTQLSSPPNLLINP